MINRFIFCVFLGLLSPILLQAQELPDAPSPQGNVPRATKSVPDAATPDPASAPPAQPDPSQPAATPAPDQPSLDTPPTTPAPSSEVKTLPPGSVSPQQTGSDREKLFTLVKPVNFVLVPVTVKDGNGHLFPGLTRDSFSVYEDGRRQNVNFFTSDPFPISAAILIDVGMADVALKKVADTFASVIGAFSSFDEAAVYTFGNTVRLQQDFLAAHSDKIAAALRRSGAIRGRSSGPMVADNPMTAGPSVNGRPADPTAPVSTLTRNTQLDEPSRVLNDAVLRAAVDLGKRDRTRRKIIFVISDGREQGSRASYSDALKVLLSNEVSLYAVAVDVGAMPVYNKLNKIRLPRQGYGNILPKYAAATGGEVFPELTRGSIEQTYALITEVARNQYTVGYNAAPATSGTYRSIEIRVKLPGLRVYAKDGYYPLPPSRQQQTPQQ